MGVPRAHSTRGQKGRRRSHLALSTLTMVSCLQCGKPALPHRVCKSCGFYDGREVVDVLGRQLRKRQKRQEAQASS